MPFAMPQAKPSGGMLSAEGSPCVATSHTDASAATSPATSRSRGSVRARAQVASMVNAMPVLCSTVAVPALVSPTATT